MEKVETSKVHLGMKFPGPVFFDDQKNLFLPKGEAVSEFHLNAIKKWSIPYLMVLSNPGMDTKTPELEELVDLEDFEEVEELDEAEELAEEVLDVEPLTASSPESQEMYVNYKNAILKVAAVFEQIKKRAVGALAAEIEQITEHILFLVRNNESEAIQYILTTEFPDYPAASAAVDCAILTYLISNQLKYPELVISYNVTGALLHDIGMLWQPDRIVKKNSKLLPEEFTQLKSHTIEASRYITDTLMLPREIGLILLQHHENWDGKGYPGGKSGDAIDSGARIVAVADAFEAMISKKTYRNSLIAYDAMKNIINDNGKRFAPDVIKAFIICMGVFPFGSIVLLNTSAVATVVETKSSAPLRPVIRIVRDENGTVFKGDKGKLVDLETNRKTFIVRVLEPNESKGIV